MNLLSLPVALVATLSSPALAAGDAPFDWRIPMEPHPGYYVEQCVPLDAGEIVGYRVESPHPVDFNIHYRDGEDTLYPIRINHIVEYEGRIEARIEGAYCFMWINNERQKVRYTIHLSLTRD